MGIFLKLASCIISKTASYCTFRPWCRRHSMTYIVMIKSGEQSQKVDFAAPFLYEKSFITPCCGIWEGGAFLVRQADILELVLGLSARRPGSYILSQACPRVEDESKCRFGGLRACKDVCVCVGGGGRAPLLLDHFITQTSYSIYP